MFGRFSGTFSATWALAAAFMLACCSQNALYSGYVPPEIALDLLEVGVTDRTRALEVVGEPPNTAPLDNRDLYYIYQKSMLAGPLPELEIERKIVVLRFDDDDILSAIETLDKKDGRKIKPNAEQTETPGVPRPNLISDIFGNIGRFVEEK